MFEPAASDEECQELERVTGLAIPEDLRALHAIHDGSFAPLLPNGMMFLRYDAAGTTWNSLTRYADEQSGTIWSGDQTHRVNSCHRAWLPVALTDDERAVVDFAPGPRGIVGQILMPVDEIHHIVVARSVSGWINAWLDLIDDGAVVYSEEDGYGVPARGENIHELLHRRLSRK